MLEPNPDKNLELAERGLGEVLRKRLFTPGRAYGDYVTFSCASFSLNLVFYRADLWAEVFQKQRLHGAIALVNLLQFLRLPSEDRNALSTPTDASSVSAWRLERVRQIARDIDVHFDALSAFFCTGDIESKQAEVTDFVVARNAGLFRRRGDA